MEATFIGFQARERDGERMRVRLQMIMCAYTIHVHIWESERIGECLMNEPSESRCACADYCQ